jgi:ACT domain-containing protein
MKVIVVVDFELEVDEENYPSPAFSSFADELEENEEALYILVEAACEQGLLKLNKVDQQFPEEDEEDERDGS